MNSKRVIKIGTRESALAIRQAETLSAFLNMQGQVRAELVPMKTTGDRILDKSVDEIGGKGLFLKELDIALADGRTELSVHSLKDMTLDLPEEYPLIGVSKREDPRDVLVLPQDMRSTEADRSNSEANEYERNFGKDTTFYIQNDADDDLFIKLIIETGLPIGCASKRRRLQFQKMYPDAEFKLIRGNIQTRLRKLDEGEYGALILAAAGLKRLGLQDRISRYFSPDEILPAAGQGILGIQGRRDFDKELLAGYCDQEAWLCAQAETSFVRECGGGCSSPIAAYATIHEGQMTLKGLYYTPNMGADYLRDEITGSREEAVRLGVELARCMMKKLI